MVNGQPVEKIEDAILIGSALHDQKTNLLPKKTSPTSRLILGFKFPSLPAIESPIWKPTAIIWFLVAMLLLLVNLFT